MAVRDQASKITLLEFYVLLHKTIPDMKGDFLQEKQDLFYEKCFSALIETQRGYNIDPIDDMAEDTEDEPICCGGAFNKLVETFAYAHQELSFICSNRKIDLTAVNMEVYGTNTPGRSVANLVDANVQTDIMLSGKIPALVQTRTEELLLALSTKISTLPQFEFIIEIMGELAELNWNNGCPAILLKGPQDQQAKALLPKDPDPTSLWYRIA